MSNRTNVRKLTLTGKSSYYVTLPQEIIRDLKWKKGEKKVVSRQADKIIIEDWKP